MTSIHRRSAARVQRGAFARTGIAAAIAVAIAAVGFLYLTAPHGTARALDAAAAATPESAAATAGAPASAGETFHGAHDFSRMDPEPDPSPAATGAYER